MHLLYTSNMFLHVLGLWSNPSPSQKSVSWACFCNSVLEEKIEIRHLTEAYVKNSSGTKGCAM